VGERCVEFRPNRLESALWASSSISRAPELVARGMWCSTVHLSPVR
jgi:hypothetical protein